MERPLEGNALPFLGSSQKNVKHYVVGLLSKEWPLRAKTIYRRLVKEENADFTYQAVYKALQQLLEERVVEKEEAGYSLSLEWVRQVKSRTGLIEKTYVHGPAFHEEFLIHDNMTAYSGRKRVAEALTEITSRAKPGDVLFGMCKTGTDYPPEFYETLRSTIKNGTSIQFMMPLKTELANFSRFLCGLGDRAEIRSATKDHLRLYGIVGSEVMVAFSFPDSYAGILVKDEATTRYFYDYFLGFWKNGKPIKV